MIQRKGYVYRFIDMQNQTIYVGKTVDMNKRMKQHFSNKSHLAHTDLYKDVQRIEYITCKNEFESLQKELYYINYYKPRYNTASKIKQLIDPPKEKDKWKVWKVIKVMPKEQERYNRIEKLVPLATTVMFIAIIIYMLK